MSKESMVLLKNEYNTLPLKSNVGTIAVVGPNAASLAAIEGNYNAIPREPLLPVDGVAREFGSAKVLYAQGSPYVEGEPLPVPRTILHTDMSSSVLGLKGEYFADNELDGTPAATRIDPQVDFDWNSASPVAGLPVEHFSARWTGTIEVPEAGEYGFAVHVASCCDAHESFSLYVDGVLVAGRGVPEASNGVGTDNMHFNLHFDDTKLHSLKLEYRHRSGLYDAGIALQWAPKAVSLRQEALNLARQSDVILAFVGLSPDLEGEEKPEQIEGFSGGDRTDMQLPKVQQQLLESLSATGKPLVVVLLNGSALSVNWAQQHAQAILEAWYPGEGGAQAIAETLDGKNDPAGRLPVTFYSSIDQLPQFSDYSMKGRTYRYFKGKPLYEFGYGLSYTRFSYSKIEQSASKIHAGDELMVEADVQNIGPVSGDEVVQMYLLPEEGQMQSILELRGFERLHLASGERRRVRFVLDPRGMSRVDSNGARAVAPGRYRIAVGGSQPASDRNGLTAEFEVEGNLELPR
jgi:beta-glucosidase